MVDVQRHRLGQKRTMKRFVNVIPQVLLNMPKIFPDDIGHSSELDLKKNACATLPCKPDGLWDNVAEEMMIFFAESGLPVSRGTSPLSRGPLKSKGGGKTSIHYKAELATAELLLRIVVSVHQLSIGARNLLSQSQLILR